MSQGSENRVDSENVFEHKGMPVTRKLAEHIIDRVVQLSSNVYFSLGRDIEDLDEAFANHFCRVREEIFVVIEESVTHVEATHTLHKNQDAQDFVNRRLRERFTQ